MEKSRGHGSVYGSFILDRRGTLLGFDDELETLTGWPAVTIVGRNGSQRRRAVDGGTTPTLFDGEIALPDDSRHINLVLNCRDGRKLETESRVTRLAGPGEQMLVTILRVISLSAVKPAPEHAARDPLTDLLEQDAFDDQLTRDFETASFTAHPLALILANVDQLSSINNLLGNEAGDEVLHRLAGILRVRVDDESRLFRLGDDNFAVLLPGSGRGEARQIAATFRSTAERYDFFSDAASEPRIRPTLSLGAASFPADAENETDLIARAKEALAEARAMGGNRVWCYVRRPRVPLQVPVFFDGDETLLVGYTRDVSPSGAFVQTSEPMSIGMRCALAFPLPGQKGKVHVIGRIVRTVPTDTSPDSREVRIPGMGVEFERFSGFSDRQAIDTYLHAREATTLRPEDGTFSVRGS